MAADLLESALKLNPRYATAHALLALCYQMIFVQGGHREEDKTAGLKHARAAIAGAGDDATALATAAMVMGHLGWDHRAAIDTIKSALAINPSSATVNYHACHIYYLSGDFAQGRLHADRALRLSPRDPLAFQAYYAYGFTALHEGRPGEAASWFGRAAQANGGASHSFLAQAAALALDGCAGAGRALAKQHLEGGPSRYVEMFAQTGMTRELVAKLAEGARLLEAPE